jgi:hypothetical protein
MPGFNSGLKSIALAVVLACGTTAAWAQTDQVVLTFATVGDSRQDYAKPDPTQLPLSGQDQIWLQNTKAFGRIIREVAAKKANLLFFNGDMVMGYGNANPPAGVSDVNSVINSDLVRFYNEYAYWRGMAATLIEAGTYVVPVPGNHETQCRTATAAASVNATTGAYVPYVICGTLLSNGQDSLGSVNGGKNALVQNENAFRANMGDLIIDQTRLPAVLPPGQTLANVDVSDHSAMDYTTAGPQNQLSYSFDIGTSHFAVINTDVSGGNDSTAPAAWLASDFASAQTRGATNFFVFGHKPAFTYNYPGNGGASDGLDGNANGTANRDAFWAVVQQYAATYFCGHEHTFNMRQPTLANGQVSTSWQVLVGSGGSPFDPKSTASGLSPTDRDYAYAIVKIFQSGNVEIDAYGFTSAYGPTKLIQTTTLAPL